MKRKRVQSFQDILVRILDQKIPADGAGGKKKLSKREAILRKILHKAGEGDSVAQGIVIRFAREHQSRLEGTGNGTL